MRKFGRPRYLPPELRTGSEEEAAVRRIWLSVGGVVYRTSDPTARRVDPGIPDQIVLLPGLCLFWDAKHGTARLTPEQLEFGQLAPGRQTAFGWGDAEAARHYLLDRVRRRLP